MQFTCKYKYFLNNLDDNDSVFFAYCYPYTYSDCYSFVNSLVTPRSKDYLRRTTLCKTIAGNMCEMLIITNFNSS